MLVIKALHIITMVAWFAGLFYLPRLFVYHAQSYDVLSRTRFKQMEYRLYYCITWPAAILTTVFGITLISYNSKYYLTATWMHLKLGLVFLLWVYHLICGRLLKQFSSDQNNKSTAFYRVFNEVPVLFLVSIVFLVVLKPF